MVRGSRRDHPHFLYALLRLGLAPLFHLLHRQPVGDVVLVDVGHIRDGFTSDVLGGDALDVVEPHVSELRARFL